MLKEAEEVDGDPLDAAGIAEGRKDAAKRLAAMKPEQRRLVLTELKVAPELRGLAERVRKEGTNGSLNKPGIPEVEKGRIAVQIWLNQLPKDGLRKLKALGFTQVAELRPGQLLLGTVPVARMDRLIELPYVRFIEQPRFKS